MARRFGSIRQLASGNFQASFIAPDGRRIGAPVTFARQEQAETWLAAQRTDVVRSTWQAPSVGTALVRDYSVSWLSDRRDLKPRTTDLYRRLLDHHILPYLGAEQLKAVTPASVRAWQGELAEATGPTARAQAYRLFKTIMNQAVADGQVKVNPCQIKGAGNPAHAERPAPSLPQIHALADAVPARYRAMVLVAAYGGLRFGEITALTRADIILPDDGPPAVTVRRAMHRLDGKWLVGTPKTQAGRRTVALPAFLGPVIAAHLAKFVPEQPGALVFCTSSGRPVARSNWSATFGRARAEVGIGECHFHDLRHAAATMAAQTGATLKDTMARLGHASPRAALIYMHADRERDERIANALDAAARAAQLDGNPDEGAR